jgi:hypothetical protein
MRNQQSQNAATRGSGSALRGLVAVGLGLCAACTTVIEEQGYDGLELGITKAEALDRLDAQPLAIDLHAAVLRKADAESTEGVADSQVVRLAAASVGSGALTRAERTYLLQYDLWFFEQADGKRSVLLTFADGALAEIRNRREGNWLDALF